MSADFFSDVVVAPAALCASLYAKFAAREVLGDIVGHDEETVFRFQPGGGEPDLDQLSAGYGPNGGTALDELGVAFVDLDLETWTAYMESLAEPPITELTSNYPAIVAVDRAVAVPRGVRFLGGHAIRHVTTAELPGFITSWRGLVLAARGTRGLANACAPHLDRGWLNLDELGELFDAIGSRAVIAREAGLELLLLGYPPP